MATREVVTKVTNAVLFSDGLIRIDNVRASYPHLAEPYAGKRDDGTPGRLTFSIVGLLPKDTHKAAKDLCLKRIQQLLDENKVPKVAADKKFIRDGDLSDKPENEGMWTVSAREDRRPAVRGPGNRVLTPDEIPDVIYGGCYVSILIRPWFQNSTDWGKRVNSGLVAVRFMRDGEPFGEGRIGDEDVDDMMGDVEDMDDELSDDEDEL